MKVETTSTNPLEAGPGDFSSFLREMQNRGMAQLQLTVLPGGKLKEPMEEVKNINFDLLELPKEVKKAEESNVLSFKNVFINAITVYIECIVSFYLYCNI